MGAREHAAESSAVPHSPRALARSARVMDAPNDAAERARDLELVRQARAGSQPSIDRFVERMRCIPRILHAHNARTGRPLSEEDLADAAQQVFARLWARTGEFRGESRLESWVYSFCKHVFLARLRDGGRRGERALDARALELRPATERGAGVDGLDVEHVLAALLALPDEEARVVRLKQLEDLTFDEIASRLSIPSNTAKSRYYRALASLRERLKGLAPGAER